jgi:phosphoribosyl-ATP pyrophosphohydrolase
VIIPSIDISKGRAVQLRQGKEFVLDGGDPLERLEALSLVGEVAVVDLDAAMGNGENRDLIRSMVRRAPCRVGGGIRNREQAVDWLNAGAKKIMVGTAASPEFFSGLPRHRLIAAVDAEKSNVVIEGWKTKTEVDPAERVRDLAPHVGGFLFTQVEFEGGMAGFDWSAIARVRDAAGDCRVTAAGGITTAEEIGRLDGMGVDAQVGLALYTGRLTLGRALAYCLKPAPGDVRSTLDVQRSTLDVQRSTWPTVVCDEMGTVLGLVWSTRESLEQAVGRRAGVYWSRSRQQIWVKGETSGNTQTLLRVALDCDRDALRFTVRQHGVGFCHTGSRSCWGTDFDLVALARLIEHRKSNADPDSRTTRLLNDASLLGSKLREEAAELANAKSVDDVTHEAADVLYFTLTAMARAGVTVQDVVAELERRAGEIGRKKLEAKDDSSSGM